MTLTEALMILTLAVKFKYQCIYFVFYFINGYITLCTYKLLQSLVTLYKISGCFNILKEGHK